MASINGLRAYAVVGDEISDVELSLCLNASVEYVQGAGVPEPDDDSSLYDLLLYRLATFWLDNRSFPDESDKSYAGISGMILQLREG